MLKQQKSFFFCIVIFPNVEEILIIIRVLIILQTIKAIKGGISTKEKIYQNILYLKCKKKYKMKKKPKALRNPKQ